jgi:predicted secreted protein
MRKLGLGHDASFALLLLCVACKASPEPTPAEASAPSTATAPAPEAPGAAPGPSEASSTAAPVAAGGPKVYGETTKTISAKVGERFVVALPSNITVPFKWRLDPPDVKLFALLDEKHVDEPPAGCGDCVGYGGTRLYTFETKGSGSASLHFALKPLTDPAGASQKNVTVAVTVSP